MRQKMAAAVMAGLLLVGGACSGGKKDASEPSRDSGRKLFQPSGVVGPDSFAPSFELASYEPQTPVVALSGDVDSNAPGIYAGRTYGGSGANICDVEGMIRFLTYYEDQIGRAHV